MKQLLYVYVPGFEYDSKGPLHIDAICLDVTITDNNEQKPIDTYIYAYNDGGTIKKVKGKTIYRTTEVIDWSKKGSLRGRFNYRPEDAPMWTQEPQETSVHNRVLHGYFYDFIIADLTNPENTHHVIGIHTNPELCKNVANFNVEEHDGLFAIELEQLNVDLTLTFTFYSRINKDGEYTSEFGTEESTFVGKSTITALEEGINFFQNTPSDDYVIVGKWVQTYNPATSGVREAEFTPYPQEYVAQYFDIKNKEMTQWELPVNAGILVSDMSKDPYPVSEQSCIYPQYSYDQTAKKHVLNDQLPYLSKITSNPTLFYCNFYENHNKTYFKVPNADEVTRNSGTIWCTGVRQVNNMCFISFNDVNQQFQQDTILKTSYQLSNLDVNSLQYLYKKQPFVHICDVSLDDNVNNDIKESGFLFSIDTLGCEFDSSTNAANIRKNEHIFDEQHFNSGQYENRIDISGYWTKKIQKYSGVNYTVDATIKCTFPDSQTADIQLPVSVNLDKYYKWDMDDISKVKGITKNYIASHDNNYYIKHYNDVFTDDSNVQVPAKTNRYYTFTDDSLIPSDGRDFTIASNPIQFSIELHKSSYPLILWGGTYSGGPLTPTGGWNYYAENPNSSPISFAPSPQYPEYIARVGQSSKIYNYGLKDGYMLKSEYGGIFIGMPSTYQIDLSKSDITYTNNSDHSIKPAILNTANGYSRGKLVAVNVLPLNMLDDNPEDENTFEFSRVADTSLSSIFSLYYNVTEKYDSTFCDDVRFIGQTTNHIYYIPTININKNIQLEQDCLYVFRIQSLYYNSNKKSKLSFVFDGNSEQQEECYENKWLFYSKDKATSLQIKKLLFNNSLDNNYNILSGIGLYKVNLNSNDTVTQSLKLRLQNIPSGFINAVTDSYDIYYNVIFPAIFCAKEDVKVGERLNGYERQSDYNDDYQNDYCTNITDDPIYHHYNFSYLPDKAYYEVQGFYTIPLNGNTPSEITSFYDSGIDMGFLKSETVRI